MAKKYRFNSMEEKAIKRILKQIDCFVTVDIDLIYEIIKKYKVENKVFYVWFDAPIGYISITKALTDSLQDPNCDWKSWWLPEDSKAPNASVPVELFQFIGKDNIPFHTVIFPSTLIGSGKNWTKLHHMSSSEYLNYESGKFSKSKGIGVFGSDAKESLIPSDAWRFYIFYNRPEKSDTQFTWKDFQEKLNSELIGNLGNLVNRTLTFIQRYYDGIIPQGTEDDSLWEKVREEEKNITSLLEWAELKDAFHGIFTLSSIANKAFQDGEPWKTRTTEPEKAAGLLWNLCYIIKDLMIMIHPFMPKYAEKVLSFLGKTVINGRIGKMSPKGSLSWADLGLTEGLSTVEGNEIFFKPMDNPTMEAYKAKYAGSQKERKDAEIENAAKLAAADKKEKKMDTNMTEEIQDKKPIDQIAVFNEKIALKIAKIMKVERHPEADKLYIETLDDGCGEERVILSGLVPYCTPEELLGKSIIIADNLKPRKMRGIESRGMLLAADYTDSEGKEHVEVLNCPWAAPGTPVVLEGADASAEKSDLIDADTFFSVEITVKNKIVNIQGDRKAHV